MARQEHYDRYVSEATVDRMGLVFLLSVGFHVLFLGGLILSPKFFDFGDPKELPFEALTVQLIGNLEAPAPAAPPVEVDPQPNAPNVVELPSADPILPQPTPLERMIAPPTPTEVIPIGQRPPDAPTPPTKRPDPPPKVRIPEKPPETPPPAQKKPLQANPAKTTNSAVEALKRKIATEEADRDIQAKLADLAKTRGQDDGTSSDSATGRSDGTRIDPIKAQYYNQIKEIVRSNWVAPISAFGTNGNLGATYVVAIQPNGRISGKNLRHSSGDPDFDSSIEQAIVRSNFPPLPPVFEGRADNPALQFELSYLNRNG